MSLKPVSSAGEENSLTIAVRIGWELLRLGLAILLHRMRTPYPNSYFSAHFKMMPVLISLLTLTKGSFLRKIDLIKQRQEGVDNEAISNEIYEQTTLPGRQSKKTLASRVVDPSSIELPFQDSIYAQALQRLTPILTSYPVQYTFEQNNIYYDFKDNPCEHMMAFYQLAHLFEHSIVAPFIELYQ
ncbi:hypothetical protein RO3G_07284 [Rhizopus delemar RA 99-880]|uniref:Uncharacterized protein n=1 Tax=Rhizopus delemar (strain RA 99-880 / ATCC MYA-4621 / FGSC 9543 / NRRL 43880) TaxID=246409 RepID=I1C299_RHIO9|nr:hypothetical protein RO3G_07284 [Rhizopus delemar RA 99-880]|eukprot:EIE82579.1 hypothetical protein RO3G_07284 [Rhizopus delemar RA 99-880]